MAELCRCACGVEQKRFPRITLQEFEWLHGGRWSLGLKSSLGKLAMKLYEALYGGKPQFEYTSHYNKTAAYPCRVLEQAYRELVPDHAAVAPVGRCRAAPLAIKDFEEMLGAEWDRSFRSKLAARATAAFKKRYGQKPKTRRSSSAPGHTGQINLYPQVFLEQALAALQRV